MLKKSSCGDYLVHESMILAELFHECHSFTPPFTHHSFLPPFTLSGFFRWIDGGSLSGTRIHKLRKASYLLRHHVWVTVLSLRETIGFPVADERFRAAIEDQLPIPDAVGGVSKVAKQCREVPDLDVGVRLLSAAPAAQEILQMGRKRISPNSSNDAFDSFAT
jgi:hypothetical protein